MLAKVWARMVCFWMRHCTGQVRHDASEHDAESAWSVVLLDARGKDEEESTWQVRRYRSVSKMYTHTVKKSRQRRDGFLSCVKQTRRVTVRR